MTDVEWNGKWHPFAERFPMLGEQELRDMADSIKETGQLHACVMDAEGLGLDGRNRVAACRIAGVKPVWTVNDGNPMGIIIAANVHHRFLSTGQRAMAVAVELSDKGLRQVGRWKRGSIPDPGDIVNSNNIDTWRGAMNRAGVVIDYLPHLADDVLADILALDAAYKQALEEKRAKEAQADQEEQRRCRIDALPDDLAALVDNGIRDLVDAEQEAEDRNIVNELDTIRNGDGAPAPSFAARIESGALTWTEAATLAKGWKQERDEAISREQQRIRQVTDGGWAAVRTVAKDPKHPYAVAIIEGLEPSRQEALREIINELKGRA